MPRKFHRWHAQFRNPTRWNDGDRRGAAGLRGNLASAFSYRAFSRSLDAGTPRWDPRLQRGSAMTFIPRGYIKHRYNTRARARVWRAHSWTSRSGWPGKTTNLHSRIRAIISLILLLLYRFTCYCVVIIIITTVFTSARQSRIIRYIIRIYERAAATCRRTAAAGAHAFRENSEK